MNVRPMFLVLFAVCITVVAAAAEGEHKLKPVKQAAKGLSEKVTAELQESGFQVNGPKGEICTIWLAKSIAVKPNFKPQFTVKYPFQPGQLIGAISVPKGALFKDFRGQEIKAGSYTLRYGQQPEDGNHIGTSELADFLLALPGKADANPDPIKGFEALSEKSAAAAGSTHPAIFSLLPDGKAGDAALKHNADRDFWILNITAPGKAENKETKVPMRLVVVGESEV